MLSQPHSGSAMASRGQSFKAIVKEKPALDELCEHVQLGAKWFQFGVALKLSYRELDEIKHSKEDYQLKMFQLWLTSNPNPSRKQIIDALKTKQINEQAIAKEYEDMLNEKICNEGKHMCTSGF